MSSKVMGRLTGAGALGALCAGQNVAAKASARERTNVILRMVFPVRAGKDGYSAKKKFTPRMDWFVSGPVKFVVSHPFRKVREKNGAPMLYKETSVDRVVHATAGREAGATVSSPAGR
jgi:hypothetical protein